MARTIETVARTQPESHGGVEESTEIKRGKCEGTRTTNLRLLMVEEDSLMQYSSKDPAVEGMKSVDLCWGRAKMVGMEGWAYLQNTKKETSVCDVCEKAAATVICCADEAALCGKCDVEVHAANKLASKHQRLLLQSLSNNLPRCDICQEKAAFIFCVEDRALFCKDCDEPIHSANSRAANHQRFLATGIRVALSNSCNKEETSKNHIEPEPPKSNSQHSGLKAAPSHHVSAITSPSWAVDDLLQFSDYESSGKKEQIEFNELEWLTDINLFGEQVSHEALTTAEVPQLPSFHPNNINSYRPSKYYTPHKKPRLEISDDDEEFFTVPDLG
ncbi:hypothetical protein BUALT_Bualt14G0020000 [Buddleja alternifolia]|uniref:B box-type domain-containing protein n=1 Tax=Buddleja alternifolia TaxID=168488 RepID=A0AAV6WNR3_9LAMI|nr:hypothetical protein BUALT_Bualt14G0020000 [Buddleja alternifolia]